MAAEIIGRICQSCKLYFASKKAADSHAKASGHTKQSQKTSTNKKVARVLARRGKEVLCMLKNNLTPTENFEWLQENSIESDNILIPDFSTEAAAEIRSVK